MGVCLRREPDTQLKIRSLGESASYDLCCHPYRQVSHSLPLYPAKTDRGSVVLLKVLYTNECARNCAYCAFNVRSSVRRMSFSVRELVNATLGLYRKGLIRGLFLSSSIPENPSKVMEKMLQVARELRTKWNFQGYIHLKILPGAHPDLVYQAMLYADRVSVNLEFPTPAGLKLLAPEKSFKQILSYFRLINDILDERKEVFRAKSQTTQVIVGATQETDWHFLHFAHTAYSNYRLRRIYYSPFRRVTDDFNLPSPEPSTIYARTKRLYQADALLRTYGFTPHELLGKGNVNLPLDKDPKEWWAERHMEFFPIDLRTASREEMLRVPGIGPETADKISKVRKYINVPSELCKLIPRKAFKFILWKGKGIFGAPRQTSLFPSHAGTQISSSPSLLRTTCPSSSRSSRMPVTSEIARKRS